MNCQTDRPSIFKAGSGPVNDVAYNDRELQGFDNKACLRRNSNLGTNWANMKKTKGRDDTMYHISDGYNLIKSKAGNQFDNLLKLQSPSKLRMQPIYYDYSKDPKKSGKGSQLAVHPVASVGSNLNTIASM